jgi:hypothetical protein
MRKSYSVLGVTVLLIATPLLLVQRQQEKSENPYGLQATTPAFNCFPRNYSFLASPRYDDVILLERKNLLTCL